MSRRVYQNWDSFYPYEENGNNYFEYFNAKLSVQQRISRILNQLDANISLLQKQYDVKRCQLNEKKKIDNLDVYHNFELEMKDISFDLQTKEHERREFEQRSEEIIFQLNRISQSGRRRDYEIKRVLQSFNTECERIETNLPIYAYKTRIINQVRTQQVSVIVGDTGSGKSTQICQYLYEGNLITPGTKLVCTQPRKIAAISTATRVAEELGEEIGELVGYRTGVDSQLSRETKILFMTDHILLNECLRDKNLRKYSCIIIDEAHERSIYTDLLIGIIKKLLSRRKDLRVVITSATIEPHLFARYFEMNGSILSIPGRLFPVEVTYGNEPPNEESYFKMSVDKAMDFHCGSPIESGSILVFLATPAETEEACKLMYSRVEGRSNNKPCICLPLHGKLELEEQQRVFVEPNAGVRKIVFATNSAETSITIPNVSMVIDSGFVKEASYDPKRNLDILAVTLITQSTADQRKGRAGRTRSGKCYRLYEEETFMRKMKKGSNPEILRVNLGLAFLKLYYLGVNPADFDFVESPGKSQITETVNMLVDLGAVNGNSANITPIGKWISKLPLNPYFSYFIYEAIERNVGLEAIVISAISSLSGSSLFYHGSAAKDAIAKQILESSFMKFSHTYGDVFTFLNVFRDWLQCDKRSDVDYCLRHSLNRKNLALVQSSTKEILYLLKREFAIIIPLEFQNEETNCDPIVRDILFKTFRHNLCHYLGLDFAGYLVVKSDDRIHVYSSSSLRCLGDMPEWIFFLSTLKTHKTFAINVQRIDEADVLRCVEDGLLNIDVQSIKDKRLEEISHITMGSSVFSQFVGPYFKKVLSLEKKFQNECEKHEVAIIESTRENGTIKVFTSSLNNKDWFTDQVNETVGDLTKNMLSEILEHDIGGKTRAVIQAGGVVGSILYEDEIGKLLVFGDRFKVGGLSNESVIKRFGRYGRIIFCQKFENFGKPKPVWGYIVFETSQAAQDALDDAEDVDKRELHVRVDNTATDTPKRFDYYFSMELSFGDIAIVEFSDISFVNLALHQQVIRGKEFREELWIYRLKDPLLQSHNVIVAGLPFNLSPKKLTTILCRSLSIDRHDVTEVKFINISQEFMTGLQFRSIKLCNDQCGKGSYRLNLESDRRDPFVLISGHFLDLHNGWSAFSKIRKSLPTDFDISQPMFKWSTNITGNHYDVVRKEIMECLNEFQSNPDRGYDLQLTSGGYNLILSVKSNESAVMQSFNQTKTTIESLIYVDEMNCAHSEHLHRLFDKRGRLIISKIEHETGTWIIADQNIVHLKVYGTESNRMKAFREINKFEEDLKTQQIQQVFLKGDEMPRGVAKRLIVKYGMGLDDIIEKSCLSVCEIDLFSHAILMIGDEEALKKGKSIIDDEIQCIRNDESSQNSSRSNLNCRESLLQECCACLCPIDASIGYRIESCGHPYCLFCVVEYLQVSMQNKSFPFVCSKEDCEQPYSLTDLRAFEKMGFIQLKDIVSRSIEAFVSKQSKEYFYCSRPECSYVFKSTAIYRNKKVECPICSLSHCSACQVAPYHEKRSCKSTSKEQMPRSLQKWFKENPSKRKKCSSCNMGIEKVDGCNHVVCWNCKKHICWKCLDFFDTEVGCTGHLYRVHGGFF